MTFELEPIGKYFRVKKGLGYLGKYLKPASVGLIGLNSFEGGGGYKYGGEKQYSGPFKPEQIAHPGDLFISTTDITQDGRVLASPFILPDLSKSFQTVIFSGDIVKAIKKSEGLLPEFLFNVLRVKRYREKAAYASSGTTVRRIPAEVIESLEVPVPPIKTQKAINETLGGLDSKIRLNSQLSKTLEDIAKTIFKSWFIDFDPVKAKMAGEKPVGMDDATAALFPDSMEESELGLIPKGWQYAHIRDLCATLGNGSTPLRSNSAYWDKKDVRWFKTGELADGFLVESKEYISNEALANTSVKNMPRGTVLMAIYAAPTVGRLGILTKASTFNQACTGLFPLAVYGTEFLYLNLYFKREYFNSRAIGAAQQNISKVIVEQAPVIIASNAVQKAFREIASPLFNQMETLLKESIALSEIRDSLLPRLISGELQIPEEMLAS